MNSFLFNLRDTVSGPREDFTPEQVDMLYKICKVTEFATNSALQQSLECLLNIPIERNNHILSVIDEMRTAPIPRITQFGGNDENTGDISELTTTLAAQRCTSNYQDLTAHIAETSPMSVGGGTNTTTLGLPLSRDGTNTDE